MAPALAQVPAAAPPPATEHTLRFDPAAARAPASIADVAWLTGHWEGEGLGGWSEEVWMPPRGGRMVGAFSLFRDDEPVFHELMVLTEEEGSLSLRLKHFNPDLTGWEPPDSVVDFPLVRLAPDTAWFDGLTFVRTSPDGVRIYLHLVRGGEHTEEVFEYRRGGADEQPEERPEE